MKFTLPSIAALALVVCASAALAASDSTGLEEEVIKVISSGGDPLGDDNYIEPVEPERRSKKHTARKSSHKHSARSAKDYVSTKPDSGSKLMNGNTQITWYASHDLLNPQCSDGKWNPNNNNHIGAVMYGWKYGPKCGEFVQLCNESHSRHKCVKVRIVDKCAACKQNHIDVTKASFRQLSNTGSLDEGVTHGLKLYTSGKPNPWDFDLFGPLALQK